MKRTWRPVKKEVTYEIFWFTLNKTKDGYVIEGHGEEPPQSSKERDSVLVMSNESQSFGFALHITWLSGKPAPNTPERTRGLLKVLEHVHSLLPEDQRESLKDLMIGLAHAPGTVLEIKKEYLQ